VFSFKLRPLFTPHPRYLGPTVDVDTAVKTDFTPFWGTEMQFLDDPCAMLCNI